MRHLAAVLLGCAIALPAHAAPFFFSTGDPDGRMGMASRPASAGLIETEAADDFMTSSLTTITSAGFYGLIPIGASLADLLSIDVEIYRVFPKDSDVSRTSGPPTFSTSQVPTRVNSPSDVAFDSRGTSDSSLSFACSVLAGSFTVGNSVVSGINPKPNQTTGGDGAATGQEVFCDVTFATPFTLPADHYFFVPQVGLTSGSFLWLSAPKPIVAPGTPFAPDLQAWIRDSDLAPDWLRVGTDIVGGSPVPTFNGAFSLVGEAESAAVPAPGTLALLLGAVGAGAIVHRRRAHTPLTRARRR